MKVMWLVCEMGQEQDSPWPVLYQETPWHPPPGLCVFTQAIGRMPEVPKNGQSKLLPGSSADVIIVTVQSSRNFLHPSWSLGTVR